MWNCYILLCADSSLYTGITTDLKKRIQQHNTQKGAKYTRTRLPVTLVWSEALATESQARKREWQIKKLSKQEKLRLVHSTI